MGHRRRGHSWYRGMSPAPYDDETRRCLAALTPVVDADRARHVWETALDADWHGTPVWFHGDVAAGNLLVRGGELSAVIDFGTSGVGDPACNLVIAWTKFTGPSRAAFRAAVGQDDATWAGAHGWQLWKSLLVLSQTLDTAPDEAVGTRRLVEEMLAEHDRFG